MPPPVADFSDDESTGSSIPYDETGDRKQEADSVKDEDDEEQGSEGEEEGVFIVEKILDHSFTPKGGLMFRVKWKGYDKPEDETLEPEENLLEGAEDVVKAYYKALGGRPEKPEKSQAQRKRKSIGRPKSTPEKPEPKRSRRSRGASESETAEKKPKRQTKEDKKKVEEDEDDVDESLEGSDLAEWMPKQKNWDPLVSNVETIVRENDILVAFINWNNGRKSKVSISMCYEKCPRKMLQFYESHLVFKDA